MSNRYKMTIVLGDLAGPLEQAAKERGVTLSNEVRIRLAESLGVRRPLFRPSVAQTDVERRIEISRKAHEAKARLKALRGMRPPDLSDDERKELDGKIAAIDLKTGRPIAAAPDRKKLCAMVKPLQNGVDYYAYFVRVR